MSDEACETFGARLRRLRLARQVRRLDEWSATAVARKLGVSVMSMYWWERDRNHPSPERLAQLAELLGCSEAYLRCGDNDPTAAQLETLRGKIRAFLAHPRPGRSRERRELQQMVQS